jgi:hypothetical protein
VRDVPFSVAVRASTSPLNRVAKCLEVGRRGRPLRHEGFLRQFIVARASRAFEVTIVTHTKYFVNRRSLCFLSPALATIRHVQPHYAASPGGTRAVRRKLLPSNGSLPVFVSLGRYILVEELSKRRSDTMPLVSRIQRERD